MAVDAVILARAWFSESVMNRNLIPFAFSTSDESFRASVICELDTIAIVTVLPDAPSDPAPAQPDSVRHTTAITTMTMPTRRNICGPHFLLLIQKPAGTGEIAHQIVGEPAEQNPQRSLVL